MLRRPAPAPNLPYLPTEEHNRHGGENIGYFIPFSHIAPSDERPIVSLTEARKYMAHMGHSGVAPTLFQEDLGVGTFTMLDEGRLEPLVPALALMNASLIKTRNYLLEPQAGILRAGGWLFHDIIPTCVCRIRGYNMVMFLASDAGAWLKLPSFASWWNFTVDKEAL